MMADSRKVQRHNFDRVNDMKVRNYNAHHLYNLYRILQD